MAAFNEEMEELRAALDDANQRINAVRVASAATTSARPPTPDAHVQLEEERRLLNVDELTDRAEAAEAARVEAVEATAAAQREVEREKELNENLETRVTELGVSIQGLQRDMENLQEENRRLRQQLDRANDDLQRERQRASEASALGARVARDRAYHNSELDKAVNENLELRAEVVAVREELHHYEEAVVKLTNDLDDAADDRAALENALREANTRIQDLTAELEEANRATASAQAAVDAKRSEVVNVSAQLESAAVRAAADLKAANDRSSGLERTIAQLQAEISRLKEQTRVKEWEDKVTEAQQQLVVVTTERDDTAALLLESNQTIEKLTARIQELEVNVDDQVAVALAQERRRLEDALRELQVANIRVRDEHERFEEIVAQKVEVEEKLQEATTRLERYEAEYGLEDAVLEQEQLREAVRIRDADISRLTKLVAEHLDAYDMLTEISRRLAVEGGRPDDVDVWKIYPDADVRGAVQGTIERLRAVNKELMDQNDALEEQRTRLLRMLRVHAENMGEKSVKAYGLSAEQMLKVNEFIENLKDNKDFLPLNDRSVELMKRVRELTNRVEDLNAQLYAARAALLHPNARAPAPVALISTGGDADADALRAQAAAQEAAARAAEASMRELQGHQDGLRQALKDLLEENKRLRHDISELAKGQDARFAKLQQERDQELLASRAAEASRLAALRAAAAQFAGSAPVTPDTDAAIRDVYSILRNKLDTGSMLDAHEMAALYRAFARVIQSNEDVSVQLQREHERCADALSQLEATSQELQRVRDAHSQQSADFNSMVRVQASLRAMLDGQKRGDAGATGATSSAVKRILQRHVESLQSMDVTALSAEATDAYAALLQALELLLQREAEVSAAEQAAREYNDHIGDIITQHLALYNTYISERTASQQELQQAKEKAAEAAAAAEGFAAKAARLDELTAALDSSDGASSQQTAADLAKRLTRQLAAMEVAQPALARKYNLAMAELSGARTASRAAELTALEVETHARHRILYLEMWKRGAEVRLQRFTEMAQSWVPGEDYEKVLTSLNELQQRYTDLLEEEASQRAANLALRSLPAKVEHLQHDKVALVADLRAMEQQLAATRTALAEAVSAIAPPASTSTVPIQGPSALMSATPALLSSSSKSELIQMILQLRTRASEAEIEGTARGKRVALLDERIRVLEVALESEQARANLAADSLQRARQAAASAEAEREATVRAVAGGLTAPQASQLQQRLQALEDDNAALQRELKKARELADIASDQAAAVTALVRDREEELAALQQQLRDNAARTDDDAIIGRLQAQLLSQTATFHAFLRKHDSVRLAYQRTRVALMAAEVAMDQNNGEVMAVREDARVKQLALQDVLDNLRTQLRSVGRDGFTLAQAQAFNDVIRRVTGTLHQREQELDNAIRAQHASQERAESLAVQLEAQRAELLDLRALGRSGADTQDLARRISNLHDQVTTAQLASVRSRRELVQLQDEHRLVTKRLTDAQEHIAALEDRILRADADARRREQEQHLIARASSGPNVESHSQSAAGTQSVALTDADNTAARSDLADGLRAQCDALQQEAQRLRVMNRKALMRARLRRKRILYLARQLRDAGVPVQDIELDVDDGFASADADLRTPSDLHRSADDTDFGADAGRDDDDDDDDGDDGDGAKQRPPSRKSAAQRHAEGEQTRLQQAAQKTIASLKELLAKKTRTIEEYQEKLERLRRENEAERATELAERERITKAAYDENHATIERLRSALRELQSAPASLASAGVNQQLLERADALEAALEQRDRLLKELEVVCATLRDSLHTTQQRAAQAEATVESLSAQLEALQKHARDVEATAAARDAATSATIEDMRKQLEARDKKLKALQLSLTALKEEFVRAEEEHAVAIAQLRAGRGGKPTERHAPVPAAAPSESREEQAALQLRVQALLDTVERMRGEVAAIRARESSAEQAREALSKEADALRSDVMAARQRCQLLEASEARAREAASRLQHELEIARASEAQRVAEALAKFSAATAVPASDNATSFVDPGEHEILRRRVRVLEAQVAALRSAASGAAAEASNASEPAAPAPPLTTRIPLPELHPRRRPSSDAAGAPATAAPADNMNDRVRALLEQERKLRKKIETLSATASEKQREAEAAKASEAASAAALTRLKSERDTMERKLQALQKRQANLDAATAAALAEIEPISALKARIHELEEQYATLRTRCDGELTARISQLEAECTAERARVAELEHTESELRGRIQELVSGASASDVEAALRDKVADARRQLAVMQTTLAARDATILELQFDVEAGRQAADRLRKRIAEVTAFATIASKGKPLDAAADAAAATSKARADSAAPGSKREAELEELVTALRRVSDKQRLELERLRKQQQAAKPQAASTSAASPAPPPVPPTSQPAAVEPARATRVEAAVLRERVATLERENRELASASTTATEAKTQAAALRDRMAVLEAENARLRAMQDRAAPVDQRSTIAPAPAPIAPAVSMVVTAPAAMDDAERDALRRRIAALEAENAAMREELSAFDSNFFDEIEDLKWKYSQAANKCRAFDVYVRAYPPVAGLPPELRDMLGGITMGSA